MCTRIRNCAAIMLAFVGLAMLGGCCGHCGDQSKADRMSVRSIAMNQNDRGEAAKYELPR